MADQSRNMFSSERNPNKNIFPGDVVYNYFNIILNFVNTMYIQKQFIFKYNQSVN